VTYSKVLGTSPLASIWRSPAEQDHHQSTAIPFLMLDELEPY